MAETQLSVSWLIPNKVILASISGNVNADKLIEGIEGVNALLISVPPTQDHVHFILDTRGVTKAIPLTDIPKVIRHMRFNSNTGWMVVIDEANLLIRFTVSLAQQMLKLRNRTFASMEESIAFLKSVDETIDWDLQVSSSVSEFRVVSDKPNLG